MSRSDRNKRYALVALFFALLAIVVCVWVEKQYQYQNYQDGQTNTEYSHDQYGPAEGHWLPEFSARDTYAQWIVAVLTVVATVISGWAVWLVYGSLELNRQAVKAAEAAVAVTREIGQAESRAYIHVEKAFLRNAKSDFRTVIDITYKNYGQTPARNVRHSGASYIIIGVLNQKSGSLDAAGESVDLGPSQTMTTSIPADIELIKGMTGAIEKNVAKIVIEGVISYNDVFSDTVRMTRYRMLHHPHPKDGLIDSDVFSICDEHNEAT